jgi:hypothetical protein
MIQTGQDARFSLEASQPIGIGGKRLRQDLDRHVAPEPGVTGPVHLAHPADTDPFVHEIHAKATARQGGGAIVSHRLHDRRWRQTLESVR